MRAPLALIVATTLTSCTVTWRTGTVDTLPPDATGDDVLIVERDVALDVHVTGVDAIRITGRLRHVWRMPPTPYTDEWMLTRPDDEAPETTAAWLRWQPLPFVPDQEVAIDRGAIRYVRVGSRHLSHGGAVVLAGAGYILLSIAAVAALAAASASSLD